MNRATFEGPISSEIQFNSLNDGRVAVTFNVAATGPYKETRGKYAGKWHMEYFKVVAFDDTAKYIYNYGHKGKIIRVTGYLRNRYFDVKVGRRTVKRNYAELVVLSAHDVWFEGELYAE